MATNVSTIQVKVAADVANFSRDMNRATREVKQLERSTKDISLGFATFAAYSTTASLGLREFANVLPPTAAGAKQLVGSISNVAAGFGTASSVAATLAAGAGQLSKAFTTVTAAGKLMNATVLANPYVAAMAGVAALATALWGLKKAYDASRDSAMRARLTGLGAFPHERQNLWNLDANVTAFARGASPGFQSTQSIASFATSEWQAAVAGIRPVTDSVIGAMNVAFGSVRGMLRNAKDLTQAEVTDLLRMLAELRRTTRIEPPALAPSSAFRKFNRPSENRLQSLNPREFLGAMMDATPATLGLDTQTNKMIAAFAAGWQSVRTAIVDQLPLRLSMLIVGRTPAGAVGGALGGTFGAGVGKALVNSAWTGIGGAIGTAFFPVVGSVVGAWLGSTIGDFFGRPRKVADDLTSSFAALNKQVDQITESIPNLPTGIKIAAYRFNASDPAEDAFMPRFSRPRNYIYIAELKVSAENANDFVKQLSAAAETNAARGGASGFSLAAGQVARGV